MPAFPSLCMNTLELEEETNQRNKPGSSLYLVADDNEDIVETLYSTTSLSIHKSL